MRVTKETGDTNLRYGKPWIAKITEWPTGKRPKMEFGGWANNTDCSSHSKSGMLEIDAEPGDIVRWCVKNYRDSTGWCIVEPDGTLRDVKQSEAREYWVSQATAPFTCPLCGQRPADINYKTVLVCCLDCLLEMNNDQARKFLESKTAPASVGG